MLTRLTIALLIAAISGHGNAVSAQEENSRDLELVEYTPDFEFRDGIYPNFQAVKRNDPIPKTRLVTDADLFSRDFYEQVTQKKRILQMYYV